MNMMTLFDLSFDELLAVLDGLDEPAFRAAQVWHAAFRDLASSYSEATTLPKALRQQLEETLPWQASTVLRTLPSSDHQTTKLLLQLTDKETIEAVVMRYANRNTVCISTQVGCAMACQFCATGQSGFTRDLSTAEIVDQVLTAARLLQCESSHISNVVLMGMGEPMANYQATLKAIQILNDSRGFSLGARSFTISTVGIVPGIRWLADEKLQVNLAISLHTADETLRSQLVPMNHRYPVSEIVRACRAYVRATRRRVTFEVALIAGVNDTDAHAKQIADALHGVLCHINIIPYNATAGSNWHASPNERVQAFAHVIESVGYPVTIRQSRGTDIQAGCGQLRAEESD